ncbi:MAG TPA: VOC family protein [Candidatus Limnocylindrales bacterium]|jgi:glyoxylase I family protein|nr:VOC family protein [Candidatus Limnocylindrales bacterium]
MKVVRSVDHISFSVRDLDTSLRFYCDVLGLEKAPRPDLGFPGAWLTVGDAQVHLLQVPEGFDGGTPPPSLNPLASHAAFGIDDHAATRDHLKRHGHEIFELEASGQMWVKDPDGYIIELISSRR